MREQPTRIRTGAVKKHCMSIAAGIFALACIIGILCAVFYQAPYSPPSYDITAQQGIPSPASNMGYGPVEAEGAFPFSLAGTIYQQEDSSVLVYFTNPADSGVNMMCEIKNENGEKLYQSGVIRPGEYVERLKPLKKLENEAMKVEMKIYAFEPETWYSKGVISLGNILQPF